LGKEGNGPKGICFGRREREFLGEVEEHPPEMSRKWNLRDHAKLMQIASIWERR